MRRRDLRRVLYVLVGLALAALYASMFLNMARAWMEDTYAGHGVFVPLFSAVIAWIERERIRAALGRGKRVGLAIVALALCLLAVGYRLEALVVQGLSFSLAIAGVVICLAGRDALRASVFPVFFLTLMAPLPQSVVAAVTLDVQIFAASFAAWALRMFDMPVYQTATLIELPQMTLRVVEACNGLRFLLALVVLTSAFSRVILTGLSSRLALVAVAVPWAVVANAMRIAAIAFAVQLWGPEAASGTIHNWIGKGVWGLTILPLLGFGFWLSCHEKPLPDRAEVTA